METEKRRLPHKEVASITPRSPSENTCQSSWQPLMNWAEPIALPPQPVTAEHWRVLFALIIDRLQSKDSIPHMYTVQHCMQRTKYLIALDSPYSCVRAHLSNVRTHIFSPSLSASFDVPSLTMFGNKASRMSHANVHA